MYRSIGNSKSAASLKTHTESGTLEVCVSFVGISGIPGSRANPGPDPGAGVIFKDNPE